MKKLIALLLAVSSMAMSSSALAFDLAPIGEGNGSSRNYIDTTTMYGSNAFGANKTQDKTYLPTYRSGDLITFAISNIDTSKDMTLTFICSKILATDYDNYNVMFVDQVAVSGSSTSYTYKLRDSLEDGLYKLEIRLNGEKKDYSFLIGTPSVELLYVNEVSENATPTKADKYLLKNGKAYCFGKLSVTGGANLTQTGTSFGFVLNGTEYKKVTDLKNGITDAQAVADSSVSNNNSEVYGTGNYFFRMMLTGVDANVDVNTLPDVDVFVE